MRQIRVLHVVPKLDIGGIESMLYNYFIELNGKSEAVNWDFIVHDTDTGLIEEKLLSKGCKVYHVTPKRKNIFKYFKEMNRVMGDGNYDIVHAHQNDQSFISLAIAKHSHIKVRIAHAHTCLSREKNNSVSKKIKNFLNLYFSTDYAYCGVDAAKWCFGNIVNGKWIPNGIKTDDFMYNDEFKKKYRAEYNLKDTDIVIGMVCRLSSEKNITYALKIMKELNSENKYKLFILGDGVLRSELEKIAEKHGVSENVKFLGRINQVYSFYSFFDIFLLPSLFEGFPVSLIEAQCSNLPCIVSNNISAESFYNNIEVVGIDDKDIPEWVKRIVQNINCDRHYNNELDVFNIKYLAKELSNYYDSLCLNRRIK